MKTKKWNAARSKRKLDRMLSSFVLARDNRTCVRCGVGINDGIKVDCAHIMPKEILNLRYEPYNCVTLCCRCHKFGPESCHKNPVSFVYWLEKYKGRYILQELLCQCDKNYKFTAEEAVRIENELKRI